MATEEVRMKVASIGISLFHVMNLLYLKAMNAEVVRASRPDNAVASPYDGIRKGRSVMMKIPNPNPVVRWTKLAPTASRNISR